MSDARVGWLARALVLASCGDRPNRASSDDHVEAPRNVASPPHTITQPPGRCSDLGADSIAGIRRGMDEAAVLKQLGAPTSRSAPREHFDPMVEHQRWYSTWSWPAHDVEVAWVALDSATAPRTVDMVALGAHSDLATSCGIRIGATRADVERAYQQAMAAWQTQYAEPAARGLLSAPSGLGTDPDRPIVAISSQGAVLGMFTFVGDRLTGLALMNSSVLFVNQW